MHIKKITIKKMSVVPYTWLKLTNFVCTTCNIKNKVYIDLYETSVTFNDILGPKNKHL